MTEEKSVYGLLHEAAEPQSPGRLHSSESVLVQPQEPWCTCLSGPDNFYIDDGQRRLGKTPYQGRYLLLGASQLGASLLDGIALWLCCFFVSTCFRTLVMPIGAGRSESDQPLGLKMRNILSPIVAYTNVDVLLLLALWSNSDSPNWSAVPNWMIEKLADAEYNLVRPRPCRIAADTIRTGSSGA